MRGRTVQTLVAAMTAMVLATLAPIPSAMALDDLSLSVAAGSENVEPGDTVTVTLVVSNLSAQINGVQVRLGYDASLLTLTSISPTVLTLPVGNGWVEVESVDVAGDIDWAAIITEGQTGLNHTILTLTFTAIAEGVTSISFRPDVAPFFNKLIRADTNGTLLPNVFDSGVISIACDDGLFCNGVETFVGGVCQAGSDPCDDGIGCTDDVCDELADSCSNTPNDANCDDGFFCNGAEACDFLLDCQAGTDPCDDVVGCTDDVCDELADNCSNTPNDANCDDGLFCNGAETCDSALDCQSGTDPCDDVIGCTDDACDELGDSCSNTPNDANCDDGLFCNGAETCDAGLDCQTGTDPCDDLVGCTDDSCDDLIDICTNTANDANCVDDGLFCTGDEVCDPVLDCVSQGDPCTAGSQFCNEVGDVCDACQVDLDCDDGVACTDDTCVGGSCVLTPNDANCGDGLFCNGTETCDALLDCQVGADPCDDGIGCTLDSCDDLSDTCTHVPDDTLCDNTLFCDGLEICDALLDCQPGIAPDCDDFVVCTVDGCDEVNDTCTNTVTDALCDNGLFCDGPEFCDSILDCQIGLDPCDDGVGCTIDTCDDFLDACTNTPDDLLCDNGLFCDGAETCDAVLDCQLSTDPCAPLVCDEIGDACFSNVHVANLEVFYAGAFADAPDPSRSFLSVGSVATTGNITNYVRGITGIRVSFDNIVSFSTTADAAFSFEWTGLGGTTFSPVTDAATMITVTDAVVGGVTLVDIVLVDDHVRQRWLKVSIDATQVTSAGVELDGELIGNPAIFPSGEGTPGGDAVFLMGNMPGDVGADRRTTLTDIGEIRLQVNPVFTVPIDNVFDVDKSGRVQLTDVGQARLDVNPVLSLPLISP